jgi:pyruvate dehydrogenase E1 component alpha subunit
VVFVCENNQWALSANFAATTAVPNVADRAAAYGMPGHIVDGNDVQAVYATATAAVQRARSGRGPSLIECKTYRWEGHSVFPRPDPRPEQEVAAWKQKDPILVTRQVLMDTADLNAERDRQIQQQITRRIDEAEAFAVASPTPDPQAALQDVYV